MDPLSVQSGTAVLHRRVKEELCILLEPQGSIHICSRRWIGPGQVSEKHSAIFISSPCPLGYKFFVPSTSLSRDSHFLTGPFPLKIGQGSSKCLTVHSNTTIHPPVGTRGLLPHLYFHAGKRYIACFLWYTDVLILWDEYFEIHDLFCTLGPQGSASWGFFLYWHGRSSKRVRSI